MIYNLYSMIPNWNSLWTLLVWFVLIAVRAEKSENDWVKWNPKGKYCEEQCYPGENAIIHCKISNLTNYENSHNVTLVLNLMFDNGYNESLVRKTAKFLKFGENVHEKVIILNVSKSNEGLYRCYLHVSPGSLKVTSETFLNVTYVPRITYNNTRYKEGENVTIYSEEEVNIECKSLTKGTPATWVEQGGASGQIAVLKWKPSKQNFSKTIECRAGNETSHVHLNYVFTPLVRISNHSTFSLIDLSECVHMKYSCDWTANPGVDSVAWFANDVPLPKSTEKYLILSSDEYLKNSTIKCEVQNTRGMNSSEIYSFCVPSNNWGLFVVILIIVLLLISIISVLVTIACYRKHHKRNSKDSSTHVSNVLDEVHENIYEDIDICNA